LGESQAFEIDISGSQYFMNGQYQLLSSGKDLKITNNFVIVRSAVDTSQDALTIFQRGNYQISKLFKYYSFDTTSGIVVNPIADNIILYGLQA